MGSAISGENALEKITVATWLAESLKPFVKANAKDTATEIAATRMINGMDDFACAVNPPENFRPDEFFRKF